MKRWVSVLLTLCLVLGCACAEPAAEPETEMSQMTTKSYPVYVNNRAFIYDTAGGLPLYFLDGTDDLPYTDLNDWAAFMCFAMTEGGQDPGYELQVTPDETGDVVILTRENRYISLFDFNLGTITFEDYNSFMEPHGSRYMDITGFSETGADGLPSLLTAINSWDRYGRYTTLDLGYYRIPMIRQEGKYLLPLQTLSAIFLIPIGCGMYFNGENLFLSNKALMKDPWQNLCDSVRESEALEEAVTEPLSAYDGPAEGMQEYYLEVIANASAEGKEIVDTYREEMERNLYPLYDSVPARERSQALIEYSYNELCMELDNVYGLKEAHNISSFDTFFQQTGLYPDLMDPDAAVADKAISDLTSHWMDDGHSGFNSTSCMAVTIPEPILGTSATNDMKAAARIYTTRDRYPEAEMNYYEVGDTAYVTFDEFAMTADEADYYTTAENGTLPADTIGIIIDAHRKITRENSPVKNVVLDLSCNGGGMVLTAAYTLSWFLGEARLSVHDTFTGAQSTIVYQADVNMDHQFDDSDTLAGRGLKLYCLISSQSFSCGNLVPWAFKEDGGVILLGKTSGGGSCVVQHMTTAWGTTFQTSGYRRIAFVKNGSYYDVDRGVEPDHIIDTYEHFFDRNALTEYIHGLY